jgi:hypothetical protein
MEGNITLGTGKGISSIYTSINNCNYKDHKQKEATTLDKEKLKDLRSCHFKLGNWRRKMNTHYAKEYQ